MLSVFILCVCDSLAPFSTSFVSHTFFHAYLQLTTVNGHWITELTIFDIMHVVWYTQWIRKVTKKVCSSKCLWQAFWRKEHKILRLFPIPKRLFAIIQLFINFAEKRTMTVRGVLELCLIIVLCKCQKILSLVNSKRNNQSLMLTIEDKNKCRNERHETHCSKKITYHIVCMFFNFERVDVSHAIRVSPAFFWKLSLSAF